MRIKSRVKLFVQLRSGKRQKLTMFLLNLLNILESTLYKEKFVKS